MTALQRNCLRAAVFTLAAGLLVIGYGFWSKAAWALGLWPWPDGPLSYLFISSIVLGQGAAMVWVGVTMELNAARGGALGFAAMNAGISIYTGWLYAQRQQSLLLGWAVVCGMLALGGLVLFVSGATCERHDVRPSPGIVRASFLVFAVALFTATAMLLTRQAIVFPWPLKPDSSVMFGCLFLASAIYFFDGWLRPGAVNAFGQLLAFLVYDLVLIPPYLAHWSKTKGGFRVSLVIYLIVLFWSAGLGLWFWIRYARLKNTKP